jgi:hypothetical protein
VTRSRTALGFCGTRMLGAGVALGQLQAGVAQPIKGRAGTASGGPI